MKKDNWIIVVFFMTFILSILFSLVSNVIAASFNNIVLGIIIVVVIGFGILLDVVGTACITANEATFHSMNSRKVKGAKRAIVLIKNSNKISSICNDVVGDVCGIVSGGLGAVLAISLATTTGANNVLVSVLVSAVISSLTVGGKSIFKKYAISKSDEIIFIFSKVLSFFVREK